MYASVYGCILHTTWTHTTHNYTHPEHIFIHINRGTEPSCPIYVQQNTYNLASVARSQTKILLAMDILCCLETWRKSRETQWEPAISSPGFQGKTRRTAQGIPHDTCVTPYHYLWGGRGVKWIPASCSKETGGGNWFMVLLLASVINHRH